MSFRGVAILIGLLLLFGGIIAAIIAGTGGSKKQGGQASKGPDKGGNGGSGGSGGSSGGNPTFLEQIGASRTVEAGPMIDAAAKEFRANRTSVVRGLAKMRNSGELAPDPGKESTLKSASEALAIHTLYKLGYLDEERALNVGKDRIYDFSEFWNYWRDRNYLGGSEYERWINADPTKSRVQ